MLQLFSEQHALWQRAVAAMAHLDALMSLAGAAALSDGPCAAPSLSIKVRQLQGRSCIENLQEQSRAGRTLLHEYSSMPGMLSSPCKRTLRI